jgi:hypothetical protein
MKTLCNELGASMKLAVDGRFACSTIMNRKRFMMWIICEMLASLLLSVFKMKIFKCCSIGNKESKNHPIGNMDKKLVRK